MRINATCSLLVSTALTLVAGCSSDSKSGTTSTPPPIASQPSDKVVNTLTSAEAIQVCEEIMGYLGTALMGSACLSEAIDGTTTPADCQTAYAACQNSDAGVGGEVSCSLAAAGTANCTATVGEVSKCVSDEASATNAAASSLSCNMAGQTTTGGMTVDPPASCQALQTSCPAIAALVTQ